MTGWRATQFAAVDIETTGLDPAVDEILSVGVVPIEAGRIRAGGSLYRTLRTERAPTADTIVVHGIRPMDVEFGDEPEAALDAVVAALRGRVPVVHVQWVEQTFLTPVLAARGMPWPRRVVDTDVLMRRLLQRRGEVGPQHHVALGRVAEYFGLPVHRPHHAEGDALTTAQAFLALAHALGDGHEASVDDLTGTMTQGWWQRAFETVTRAVAPTPAVDRQSSPRSDSS